MKPAKRKAPIVGARHEPEFREIIGLIAAARHRAFQAVNTDLIDLYWCDGLSKVSPPVGELILSPKVLAVLREL